MDDIPISSTNGPGPPGQPPPGQTPPSLAPLGQPKNEVTANWVVVSCNKSESSSDYYEPHRQQQVQLDEFLASNAPEELKFADKFDGSQIDVDSEIRSTETALKLMHDFKEGIPVLSSVVKTLRSLLSWLGWRQYSASEEERGKFHQQFHAVGVELAKLELHLRCCYQNLAEKSVMRNEHLFGCDGFRTDFDSDLTCLVEKYLNRIGIPTAFSDLLSSERLGLGVDSAFIDYIRAIYFRHGRLFIVPSLRYHPLSFTSWEYSETKRITPPIPNFTYVSSVAYAPPTINQTTQLRSTDVMGHSAVLCSNIYCALAWFTEPAVVMNAVARRPLPQVQFEGDNHETAFKAAIESVKRCVLEVFDTLDLARLSSVAELAVPDDTQRDELRLALVADNLSSRFFPLVIRLYSRWAASQSSPSSLLPLRYLHRYPFGLMKIPLMAGRVFPGEYGGFAKATFPNFRVYDCDSADDIPADRGYIMTVEYYNSETKQQTVADGCYLMVPSMPATKLAAWFASRHSDFLVPGLMFPKPAIFNDHPISVYIPALFSRKLPFRLNWFAGDQIVVEQKSPFEFFAYKKFPAKFLLRNSRDFDAQLVGFTVSLENYTDLVGRIRSTTQPFHPAVKTLVVLNPSTLPVMATLSGLPLHSAPNAVPFIREAYSREGDLLELALQVYVYQTYLSFVKRLDEGALVSECMEGCCLRDRSGMSQLQIAKLAEANDRHKLGEQIQLSRERPMELGQKMIDFPNSLWSMEEVAVEALMETGLMETEEEELPLTETEEEELPLIETEEEELPNRTGPDGMADGQRDVVDLLDEDKETIDSESDADQNQLELQRAIAATESKSNPPNQKKSNPPNQKKSKPRRPRRARAPKSLRVPAARSISTRSRTGSSSSKTKPAETGPITVDGESGTQEAEPEVTSFVEGVGEDEMEKKYDKEEKEADELTSGKPKKPRKHVEQAGNKV